MSPGSAAEDLRLRGVWLPRDASRVETTAYPSQSSSGVSPMTVRVASATSTCRSAGRLNIQSLYVANMGRILSQLTAQSAR